MKRWIAGTAAAVLLIAAITIIPIPPRKVALTESSSDGRFVATFSWKPAGLLGATTEDNPWVYLTVTDRASGRVILEESTWGDAPNDDRLAEYLPWHNAKP